MVKKFIHFDVIHKRDRRTDGQTLHDSIDRTCLASRGKNAILIITVTTAQEHSESAISAKAKISKKVI